MFPELSHPSFSGHETFPLRYTWLKKGHDAVAADPKVFLADDALVRLGVGKNMVKAIRHWSYATGMMEDGEYFEGTRYKEPLITRLGAKVFGSKGWDPYLEDPGTLWVMHWQLASTPERSTTWYWLFNHQPTPEFSVDDIVRGLLRLAEERGWPKVTPASLKRDVDCCVRTYCASRKTKRAVIEDTLDSPLSELGLIRTGATRDAYVLTRERRPSLTPAIFAYALAEYLQREAGSARTVLLDDLMHQPGAPGRVFRMTAEGIISRAEALAALTDGAVLYDETAGLKQLRIEGELEPMQMLQTHYQRTSARARRTA